MKMNKGNEIQVVDNSKNGMKVSKGDRIVEFSPDLSQQICTDLISLGTQLIAETGRVTIEYFKTQANMYYAQLDAYISNQALKSEERKIILQSIGKLTDEYKELMNQTNDPEKLNQLKATYDFFTDKHSQLYQNALEIDAKTKIPKRPNLLRSLKDLFVHK
jgi:hypothetical protein